MSSQTKWRTAASFVRTAGSFIDVLRREIRVLTGVCNGGRAGCSCQWRARGPTGKTGPERRRAGSPQTRKGGRHDEAGPEVRAGVEARANARGVQGAARKGHRARVHRRILEYEG